MRWRLHDLDGALLECQDAEANAPAEWMEFARARVGLARDELALRAEATSVGSRNSWVALVLAVVLAIALCTVAGRTARA